nr:MAG TPA: hypothetical protein [Bacteriophage sp.]
MSTHKVLLTISCISCCLLSFEGFEYMLPIAIFTGISGVYSWLTDDSDN